MDEHELVYKPRDFVPEESAFQQFTHLRPTLSPSCASLHNISLCWETRKHTRFASRDISVIDESAAATWSRDTDNEDFLAERPRRVETSEFIQTKLICGPAIGTLSGSSV